MIIQTKKKTKSARAWVGNGAFSTNRLDLLQLDWQSAKQSLHRAGELKKKEKRKKGVLLYEKGLRGYMRNVPNGRSIAKQSCHGPCPFVVVHC